MDNVTPLRPGDTTPEMLLQEILKDASSIDDICIVLSTKEQTRIAMCGQREFIYRASLCLNDLATNYATGRIK